MEDDGKPDHKLLGVPTGEPVWADVESLQDLPQHLLAEITHFFEVYKDLEPAKTAALGWEDETTARRILTEAMRRRSDEHHHD